MKLRSGVDGRVAQVKVRWLDPRTREASEGYDSVNVEDLGGTLNQSSAGLRICYAAAFFAEALRRKPAPELSELARIAEDANSELDDPKVSELVALIRRAARNR